MLLSLTALLMGCAPYIKTSLYFGMSRPDGGTVTEAEFQQFLDAEVSPQLEGFTLYAARGMWQGGGEDSRVLEVIYRRGEEDGDLAEIARDYCSQFNQSAVMRVDVPVRVDFYTRDEKTP